MTPRKNHDHDNVLSLEVQSYNDLYQRSRVSVIAYFALFWFLAFLTPLYKEHTALVLIGGVLVTVLVAVRFVFALKFTPEKFEENPASWTFIFNSLALLSALLWGMISYVTLSLYTLLSYSSVYCFVMTCGIVGGGVNSLAPNFSLMKKFIALMLMPIAVWGAFNRDYTTAFFMFVYMALLLSVARATATSYVGNITSNILIQQQKNNLGKTVDAITDDSGNLKNSSHEISDISQNMHKTSVDMAAHIEDIEKTAGTIHGNAANISSSIEKASENVHSVASAMGQMAISITELSRNAGSALDVTSEAVEKTRSASDRMELLSQSAREIGTVTEMINEISDQTNLLALNATIEAARAGEAGKGFAVVASEIKELARQTAAATSRIKQQVEGIQSSTSDSAADIDAISHVITSVNDIVTSLASTVEEQSQVSRNIANDIGEMSVNMEEIKGHVATNSSLIKEIADNINATGKIGEKVMAVGSQAEQSAEGLMIMANRLNDLVSSIET